MLPAVAALLTEYADLERRLADPATHAEPDLARDLHRRYAALGPIVGAHREWERAREDLDTGLDLAAEDASFAEEVPMLREALDAAEEHLRRVLVPRDPDDGRDVILEVKAGEGGEESALFAGDLVRMYLRYAERQGWRVDVLETVESDLGGYKDARISVRSGRGADADHGPWARLKYEGGVHRVQRVPVTESQGRIHTSAAGVLVMPEAEEIDVTIEPADLRVDVYRSSGPGGQSVNTTDSAVRITHLPTGVVVSCQNEKSQLQNKEAALRVLRARLRQAAQEAADADAMAVRRSQVRTVDRSERIRTYNFPENRIADHRTGFKAYNLDHVLAGDLDAVIQSCVEADEADRVASAADPSGV